MHPRVRDRLRRAFGPLSLGRINTFLATATCFGALPADLDSDCTVGSADLDILLDASGVVDGADLSVMLAAWSWTPPG